jgi:hypothetical protein
MADLDAIEDLIEATVRDQLGARLAGTEVTIINDGMVDSEKTITL